MIDAIVIGAGPAGLMAAQTLADAGCRVTVIDAMPSVGRKFLMAGKSGLNLTKDEPIADFLAAYGSLPDAMHTAISDFGPTQVSAWAQALCQNIFTGSTGRVFPKAMKASPLLRAWLGQLNEAGVTFRTRWRWTGWHDDALQFDTPDGTKSATPDITILAMGGASWSRLGSNGAWEKWLPTVPFQPANMGFLVDWSPHMSRHFGSPVKGVALRAGSVKSRGEIVISAIGIEGGGIYDVSRAMREGAPLIIDLLPDRTLDQIRAALARPIGKNSRSNHLRKVLRLDPAAISLLSEFGRPLPDDLAPLIKSLPVTHQGPRPIDQAISTAGGVPFGALDGFRLQSHDRVFVVGEALDWEAPTGGYLITGCLASGRAGALQALGQPS